MFLETFYNCNESFRKVVVLTRIFLKCQNIFLDNSLPDLHSNVDNCEACLKVIKNYILVLFILTNDGENQIWDQHLVSYPKPHWYFFPYKAFNKWNFFVFVDKLGIIKGRE